MAVLLFPFESVEDDMVVCWKSFIPVIDDEAELFSVLVIVFVDSGRMVDDV